MKIAFISDIHGHLTALEAVLHDIKMLDCDKTYVLGDICYRGPEPEKCLAKVQETADGILKGNADEWLVRGIHRGEVPDDRLDTMMAEYAWALARLTSEDLHFLETLPLTLEGEDEGIPWLAFHATPEDLFTSVLPDASDEMLKQNVLVTDKAKLFLYGHIHIPYVRMLGEATVVNLGSVGLPFDGIAEASYAVVNAKNGDLTIDMRRVRYDVDAAVQALIDVGYPNQTYVEQVLRTASP